MYQVRVRTTRLLALQTGASIAFLHPGSTALTLVYIIAAWAVIMGAFDIVADIGLAGPLDGDRMLGLEGVDR